MLLLRAAVGITSIAQGGVYLAGGGEATFATWFAGLLGLTLGVSLLVGFATPFASVLMGMGAAGRFLSLLPVPASASPESRVSAIFVMIMATAIALLGPGAYSLDSYLFGRREIIVPPASRSTPS